MKFRIESVCPSVAYNEYKVIRLEDNTQAFRGSLADCEAYIRLNEKGYL